MSQKYVFPEKYQEKINTYLKSLGFALEEPKKIAECVLELSTHYQDASSKTPWSKRNIAGYLSYFFPLNYLRNLKVFSQIPKNFFNQTQSFIDFGAGPGTATLALADTHILPTSGIAVEPSDKAFALYNHLKDSHHPRLQHQSLVDQSNAQLGIFSYSLNELPEPPSWIFQLQKVLILEPSTKLQGRKLMSLRQEFIDKGFYIWAPCTHQGLCPLLIHSKHDWCHDRLHWEIPNWFKAIENHLPMKNNTLTHSYLVASKFPSPSALTTGRIVGDPLKEKGKTRWLFCQGGEREFLSWLKKQGPAPDWQRGDLVKFNMTERRSNEIRFTLE